MVTYLEMLLDACKIIKYKLHSQIKNNESPTTIPLDIPHAIHPIQCRLRHHVPASASATSGDHGGKLARHL